MDFLSQSFRRTSCEPSGGASCSRSASATTKMPWRGAKAEVPQGHKSGKKPKGVNIPYAGWAKGKKCLQVVYKLMVSSSGKGGFPVPLTLPEFVARYGGERRIALG